MIDCNMAVLEISSYMQVKYKQYPST